MSKDNLDVQEWLRYARTDYDTARKMADQFHLCRWKSSVISASKVRKKY